MKNTTDENLIYIKLLNGKIIFDTISNIKINYRDNDYVTPDYVYTTQDVNEISYFIKIKNEEFYIPRRLIKITNVDLFKNIIETNLKYENLEKI